MKHGVALIGGRGYTGREFLKLLSREPGLSLAIATQRSGAGGRIRDLVPEWPDAETRFQTLDPSGVSTVDASVWVLALPNDTSEPWVAAIGQHHPEALIVDLSADHRFDDHWVYGLPELNGDQIRGARRIANPGCYATGAQLGLWPLREHLAAPPVIFGVSGYSGAGTTPSPKNDPQRLADNLMPYKLTGHVHEREISHHLGHQVRFMPHVAAFFRGISLTIAVELDQPVELEMVRAWFVSAYGDEPLIEISDDVPEVSQAQDTDRVFIGGFAIDQRDPRRVNLVVVLDNLLKGAASQAMQNIHLALDQSAG